MASDPALTETPRLEAWATWPSWRQHLHRHYLVYQGAQHGLLALADQAIISGVNFATVLILARYLDPADYGMYVLLFAILLFINGLQSALITAPLMVLAPRHDAQESRPYLNALWLIQLAACLVLGIAAAAFMPLGYYWWPAITAEIDVGAVVLVVITYLGQEFVRRVLFVQRDSIGGLGVDLISYGLQFVALGGLIAYGICTLRLVLWMIGLTSLISCLFGLSRARPSITSVSRADISRTWRLHWDQGQWLAGGTIAQWGSNQLYYFVIAALLSPAATGMFAACRNLFGFTHIFLLGLENFVPATLTRRLLNDGVDAMMQWLNRFRTIGAILMGLYCLPIVLLADPLMRLLFGPQYSNVGPVVALTAIAYFISILARPPMLALRAIGKPRWIFFGFLISSVVTVVVSVPLVVTAGITGASIGMIITQLLLLAVLVAGYRRGLHTFRKSLESSSA